MYRAHVCGNRRTGSEGRTSVRPYVWATNGAIACSLWVNSMVRSQPDSQQAPILFPPLEGEG
ncbi:hypothetical protein [Coleofasciculus chthonoplastes]|uniref:hypothetical protein n=1 Tax=Coleofasciculus chthonoplastes TaxID=64178 RepID=UPI00330467F4